MGSSEHSWLCERYQRLLFAARERVRSTMAAEAKTSRTPFGYCFEHMCPDCFDNKCNCRCGESMWFIGAFVFLAACAFFVIAAPFGWNDISWYHNFNLFWFYLSFFIMAIGAAYAFCARGKNAFARNPEESDQVEKDE